MSWLDAYAYRTQITFVWRKVQLMRPSLRRAPISLVLQEGQEDIPGQQANVDRLQRLQPSISQTPGWEPPCNRGNRRTMLSGTLPE